LAELTGILCCAFLSGGGLEVVGELAAGGVAAGAEDDDDDNDDGVGCKADAAVGMITALLLVTARTFETPGPVASGSEGLTPLLLDGVGS
jgi:hypothetical protein